MKIVFGSAAAALALLAAPVSAVSFFSLGATTGPGPGDPGLAAFETSLVTFDAPLHAGIVETDAGTVGLFTGTSGIAAAPAGDTSIYQAIGTGGSATFDFRAYFASRLSAVRSLSVYIGSVDLYNHIDVLDDHLNVVATINGADLPGNNGDQGASITNRRLYINFAASEHIGGLTFRSDGVAFEYDTIGASSAVFGPIPGGGNTPPVLPPVVGVPEPASWAMLIVGFGFVASGLRRRRRVSAPA